MISEVIQKLEATRGERFSRDVSVFVQLDPEIEELQNVELSPVLLTVEDLSKARENGFRIDKHGEREKTEEMYRAGVACMGFKEIGWESFATISQEPAGIIFALYEAAMKYSGFGGNIVSEVQKKKKS